MAVMMSPREQWTDERLDDLSTRVDHGFVRMEARFDRMEARMDQRFEHMEERFDARFDALWRTMIGSAAVIIAALIGVIATQL
ncbi:MAG TPA: hypothetical protein VK480_01615 [Solirubrobacterales bacterium]|nr:hypothetical protein [Solirubrobacterales bacterium]